VPTVRTALRVDVTDEAGNPIERAEVKAAARTQLTDARGTAEFPEAELAPDLRNLVVLGPGDDFYAANLAVQLTAGRTLVSVRLVRERTVAILAARTVQRSPSGDRLSAEVDVAVLASDGGVGPPAPAAFHVMTPDCLWGYIDCVIGPDGRGIMFGVSLAWPDPGPVTAIPLAGGSDAPVVAGILVDVSAEVGSLWDPEGRRFGAVRSYFGAADGASVALGMIGGGAATPVPPAGFGVDGSRFDAVLGALVGTSGVAKVDAPTAYGAIAAMADAAAATGAPDEARRHVVAVLPNFYGLDHPCVAGEVCRRSLDAAISRARARGVRVITVGHSDQLADLAVRTDGVYVDVDRAAELERVVRALPRLLDGTVPRQRLSFEFAARPETFVPGGTVYAILEISFGDGQADYASLAVPIPAS
jgi:hypothetical protein